jgi:hypothetical protein
MSSPAQIGQALNKLFKASRRDALDINPHFVPINVEIAKLTLTSVLRQAGTELDDPGMVANAASIMSGVETYIKNKHKNSLHLQSLPNDFYTNQAKYLPAVVYSNGNIVGALYGSYDKAYSGLFKDYLNKEVSKFLSQKRYDDNLAERQAASAEGKVAKEYKAGFDVGHLISSSAGYTVSPAYLKLTETIATIEDMLNGHSVASAEIPPGLVEKHKTDLQSLKTNIETQLEILKSRSVYGTKIAIELKKDVDLDKFLFSSKAVVVIAQDRLENQYFFGTLLEGKVVDAVYKLLATVNYSRNIVEEITYVATSILKGVKLNGKKPVSKKLPEIIVTPNKVNVKATSGPKGKKHTPKKSSAVSPKVIPNLINLQNLINSQLQDVISANMGNGGSRNVLNYRTGRLAASAKVERMSESRAGMITAFYSYMKNPYATFSDGGRQSIPKTRDPKLLISKSIREIAATQVANQLRAVNV